MRHYLNGSLIQFICVNDNVCRTRHNIEYLSTDRHAYTHLILRSTMTCFLKYELHDISRAPFNILMNNTPRKLHTHIHTHTSPLYVHSLLLLIISLTLSKH